MCAKTCVIELQTYSLFFNKTIKLETNLTNILSNLEVLNHAMPG